MMTKDKKHLIIEKKGCRPTSSPSAKPPKGSTGSSSESNNVKLSEKKVKSKPKKK